jgi:hypothetical protein
MRTAFAAILVGTACAAPGGPSVAQEPPAAGVCAQVTHCRVVATRDVDGDGTPDQIGWVRHRAQKAIVVRVKTADGALLRRRLDVSLWFGVGAWGGAAPIDGRRGAEILAGTEMGAHTPLYTMLTERGGHLVVEPAPAGGETRWWVDAAYNYDFGWWRHVRKDGVVTMTQNTASRTTNTGKRFAGTNTTYAWRRGGWHRVAVAKRRYATATAAAAIAGWHVAGIGRFPGV